MLVARSAWLSVPIYRLTNLSDADRKLSGTIYQLSADIYQLITLHGSRRRRPCGHPGQLFGKNQPGLDRRAWGLRARRCADNWWNTEIEGRKTFHKFQDIDRAGKIYRQKILNFDRPGKIFRQIIHWKKVRLHGPNIFLTVQKKVNMTCWIVVIKQISINYINSTLQFHGVLGFWEWTHKNSWQPFSSSSD